MSITPEYFGNNKIFGITNIQKLSMNFYKLHEIHISNITSSLLLYFSTFIFCSILINFNLILYISNNGANSKKLNTYSIL